MKKKSLTQQTADTIYKMITRGDEFQPGDQLPGENILSEKLGVSRATLREAIRILVMQGVLEVYRGKGTYIAADMKAFGDYGLGEIQRMKINLKDLYEARLLFEPEIAAIACRRATEEELEHIITCGERVKALILQQQDRTEADGEFHRAIVAASHNDFMMRLIPVINRAIEEVILYNKEARELSEETLRDHDQLMHFLKNRDAQGAKYAMAIHIHNVIATLQLNEEEEPIF